MIDIDIAARARHTILAFALGDTLSRVSLQPALFDAEQRLSGDVWLMLATCEAIARSGGRVNAAMLTSVLRQWRADGRFRGAPESSDSAALHVAPLAFVIDPGNATDRDLVRDIIAATWNDEGAVPDALAVVSTLRACLETARLPLDISPAASPDMPKALQDALAVAMRSPDDLELALVAATSGGHGGRVAALTGLLLGVTGCDVPKALLDTLPERDDVEAVIEPFAQLIAAAAG